MNGWTNVEDLIASLKRRWMAGVYLRDHASNVPWAPIELPVRAPSANEFLERFDDARRWAERFQRESHSRRGLERFAVTYRTVQSKHLGANSVPARVRIESFEQLCTLLGTGSEVHQLDELIEQTKASIPELVEWIAVNPLLAIEHLPVWPSVLSAVSWIADEGASPRYLRQIDLEGVDTKFIDHHRALLDELLTAVLPEDRIDAGYGTRDFARRFRLRAKPTYTRLRLLSREPVVPSALSEITVRTEELATLELSARTVFVVENEITYLAFPIVADAIVVFGSGFGLAALREVPWLDDREIVYWGDIDTHGFSILNQLRSRFPCAKSMLMDHSTLLAHPRQWVKEPRPTNQALTNLTDAEGALYHDLIEDRYGHGVRLEQERVRFSLLSRALEPWTE